MKETINRLLVILNKYSLKDVNKIYRDKEVELEIESFTKHPEVRWSESMQKRMIQEAKRKRISPGRLKYIESQIEELNNYNQEEHIKLAKDDLSKLLDNLTKTKIQLSDILLLHIEFSDLHPIAYVKAYGKFDEKWYENELGGFDSKFTSSKYWDELESSKFSNLAEQLEIVDLEEEEYPQIFVQIRELRVFQVIKTASELPPIKERIKQIIPMAKIEIGFHDATFYKIHDNNHAL